MESLTRPRPMSFVLFTIHYSSITRLNKLQMNEFLYVEYDFFDWYRKATEYKKLRTFKSQAEFSSFPHWLVI